MSVRSLQARLARLDVSNPEALRDFLSEILTIMSESEASVGAQVEDWRTEFNTNLRSGDDGPAGHVQHEESRQMNTRYGLTQAHVAGLPASLSKIAKGIRPAGMNSGKA